MIDTLNFRLDNSQFDRQHILRVFATKTKEGKVTYYPNDNKVLVVHYKNYRLTLSEKYLTAYGSLTKLHYGNNLQQLTFKQVHDTINELEDFFEIALDEAQIIRVDFACNIELNNSVARYLDLFVSPKGFKTIIYMGESLYFDKSAQTICFYDKVKETQAKSNRLLNGLTKKNILRYEVRVKKNVASVLKWPNAKISNLSDYNNYLSLLRLFYLSYKSLPSYREPVPSSLNFDSLTAYKNSLILEGIKSFGGTQKTEIALRDKTIKREVRCSIRKFIAQLSSGKIINQDLKNELNYKITSICKYEISQAKYWA